MPPSHTSHDGDDHGEEGTISPEKLETRNKQRARWNKERARTAVEVEEGAEVTIAEEGAEVTVVENGGEVTNRQDGIDVADLSPEDSDRIKRLLNRAILLMALAIVFTLLLRLGTLLGILDSGWLP